MNVQIGGVKPVFATVLRFKTKQFRTPFRLQYLGLSGDSQLIFSDGVHSYGCRVSKSYVKSFLNGVFKPNTVFNVLECSREKGAPQNVTLSNLQVTPSNLTFVIGKPKPFV